MRLSAVTLGLCLAVQGALASPVPQIRPDSCTSFTPDWAEDATARSLDPILGLPPIPHPQDNPPTAAKIELGRKLFFDRRLSINKTMSCAMCHVPEQGFANWELLTSVGVEGRSVKRNAPTVINVGYLGVLFHDGRDTALETQFIAPMVARNEMANPSVGRVVDFLEGDAEYQQMFDQAFGAQASLDRIGKALASYQRSLVGGPSDFDRWFYGGEEDAMSDAQKRGFEIFRGKGDCAACHTIEDDYALFTDELHHDTGYGWMREQIRQNPPESIMVEIAPGVVHEVDYARVASVSGKKEGDLGRYEVTEDPQDRWKFRTPSLRNLTLTRPYMHDGALRELSEVIAFYNEGGPGTALQDPRVRPLNLSEAEMDDLEAFLEALTNTGVDCLVAEARSTPPDNH